MSEITIEIVEDRDHPEGGHAVIRLNGLWLLPANVTYRIDPDGDNDAEPPADWPRGDHSPLATRLTPHGVEIVAGPEVVDAPALVPGTRVAISIPAAFVRVETLWPDLPLSKPDASAQGSLTAAELAAELEAAAEARRKGEEADEPPRDIELTPVAEVRAEGDREQAVNGVERYPRETERDAHLSALIPREGRAGFIPPEPPGGGASEALPPSAGTNAPIPYPVLVKGAAGHPRPLHAQETVVPPATAIAAIAPVAAEPRQQKALVPVAKSLAPPPRRSLSIGVPFFLGVLIATALTTLVATKQIGPWPALPLFAESAPAAPDLSPNLSDLLSIAATSPQGRDALDVDLQTALKLADESLHKGTGMSDRTEASFWLKKALALSVGTPQLTWTLTQLGTLYAQPASGVADFGKARLLWEMAASGGDAVALCFLGVLHENGLGVPKSRRDALSYFEKAKAHGGCRDVDAAIARVRG